MPPELLKTSLYLQNRASLLSLSQQSSDGPSQLSFVLLSSVCLALCPFPSSRPVPITAPVVHGSRLGQGPGDGSYSRERGKMEVRFISAQISMWGANHGRVVVIEVRSLCFESAGTAFSSHPENDLIYS